MDIQTLKLFMETQAIQSLGSTNNANATGSTTFSDMISQFLTENSTADTTELSNLLGSYGSMAAEQDKQNVANYLQNLIYEGTVNIPPNVLQAISSWSGTTASNGTSTTSSVQAGSTTINNDFKSIIENAAATYGVPAKLIESVIQHESSFNPNAVSSAGATGLMQLMPATAKYLGVSNAFNPEQNIMGGTKYLSQLMKKYDGDISLTLAAYNAGPGNVSKYNGIPPFKETQNYVKKVLNTYTT